MLALKRTAFKGASLYGRLFCSDARDKISTFYLQDKYGLDSPPSVDPGFGQGMITALASMAFGDGEFSEKEKEFVKGHFLTLNYPEKMIDDALENSADAMSSVVLLMANPKLERAKRIMLYDGLRVASSDKLESGEIMHIARMAKIMGIEERKCALTCNLTAHL